MSNTDNPGHGVLCVPFVDSDTDGLHYVKVRVGRGEWVILSRGYASVSNARGALRMVRSDMFAAYQERER